MGMISTLPVPCQEHMMNVVKHPPLYMTFPEFPEFREKIHSLEMSSSHFCHLLASYNEINSTLTQIENGKSINSTAPLEELEALHMYLKDQLFAMLVHN
jgi:uncharacterized protein